MKLSEEIRRGGLTISKSPELPEPPPVSDIGTVFLSESLPESESKSSPRSVPSASSSAFTTEIECFRLDLLLFGCDTIPNPSEPPFAIGFVSSFPFSFACDERGI